MGVHAQGESGFFDEDCEGVVENEGVVQAQQHEPANHGANGEQCDLSKNFRPLFRAVSLNSPFLSLESSAIIYCFKQLRLGLVWAFRYVFKLVIFFFKF